MTDSKEAVLDFTIEQLKSYIASNYSKKSQTHYFGILNDFARYAVGDERTPSEVVAAYYEIATKAKPFQRPENNWYMFKARTMFMLLDAIKGDEPKREYIYNKNIYTGVFMPQVIAFGEWQREIGNSEVTLHRKSVCIRDFLRFLESVNITVPEQVSVDAVLSYLQSREDVSSNNKRYVAYALRSFLTSPAMHDKLSFAPESLLGGFRSKPNNRLKSFYTPEELQKVMNAVDRTTPWGKTIYAMMLLACVYGLRVSDIRELQRSSVRWKARKIQLYQKKTKRYVELPLTEEVKFALLDYLKNVRPDSQNPCFFIRHLNPHIPYSVKDNFGSKVASYFRKAGINTDGKHFGMHSLRFSLATELLTEGVSLNEISSILGHKTIKPTKEYAWADIKNLRNAALEVPPHVER